MLSNTSDMLCRVGSETQSTVQAGNLWSRMSSYAGVFSWTLEARTLSIKP